MMGRRTFGVAEYSPCWEDVRLELQSIVNDGKTYVWSSRV